MPSENKMGIDGSDPVIGKAAGFCTGNNDPGWAISFSRKLGGSRALFYCGRAIYRRGFVRQGFCNYNRDWNWLQLNPLQSTLNEIQILENKSKILQADLSEPQNQFNLFNV